MQKQFGKGSLFCPQHNIASIQLYHVVEKIKLYKDYFIPNN